MIPFLAFWASNLIVYWSGWDIVWKLAVAVAIGFVLLPIYHLLGQDTRSSTCGQAPARSCRGWSGSWSSPGSGTTPSRRRKQPQRARLRDGHPRAVRLLGLIYALALRFPLPTRIEAHIERSMRESEEEQTLQST